MKKILISLLVFWFFLASVGFSQQEKSISAFEVVEKLVARIQQMPDNESIKNVSGTITFSAKLSDSDYANLKPLTEKLFGKVLSNPIRLEGKFISILPTAGGKIEKFMLSGKTELGDFYIYRNADNLTIFWPETGILIEDNLSEIRKISGKNLPGPPSALNEGLGMILGSISFKTVFNQIKSWFYDAAVSRVEKSGKKLIELTKKENEFDVKMYINPDNWSIAECVLLHDRATVTLNFKNTPSQKPCLADYMPESIKIDTIEKGNAVRIEFGSLTYNRVLDEGLFNLKKMKLSEFISSMAIKLFNQ